MAFKGKVTISETWCKGCGLCVHFCPKKALKINDTRVSASGYNPAVFDNTANCNACGSCYRVCPDNAITIERAKA